MRLGPFIGYRPRRSTGGALGRSLRIGRRFIFGRCCSVFVIIGIPVGILRWTSPVRARDLAGRCCGAWCWPWLGVPSDAIRSCWRARCTVFFALVLGAALCWRRCTIFFVQKPSQSAHAAHEGSWTPVI